MYDKGAARHYVAKVHRSLIQEFRDAGVHPSSSGVAARLICNPQTGLTLSEQLRHDVQGVSDQIKQIKAIIDRIDDVMLASEQT